MIIRIEAEVSMSVPVFIELPDGFDLNKLQKDAYCQLFEKSVGFKFALEESGQIKSGTFDFQFVEESEDIAFGAWKDFSPDLRLTQADVLRIESGT